MKLTLRPISICLAFLFFAQFGIVAGSRIAAPPAQASWAVFVPEGEEFAATVPGPVTVLNESANYTYKRGGEKVLQHRDYSGYGDGLVFIIESYKVNHPKEILGELLSQNARGANFDRELSFGGLTANQYRANNSRFHSRLISFVTKQHVYFLTLATLDDTNSAADRFLSAFRLRTPQDLNNPGSATESSDANPSDVLSSRDVDRRVVIAWKPIAGYTERARMDRVSGTVVVEGVFAPNGYVTNIKVIKELKDGLSERAVECTRSIRFFPAEKNGKPAAQSLHVEYNFNLY